MSTVTPTRALADLLEGEHISYEVIPHRRTQSAAAEARAIGLDPGEVAKTVVLTTDNGFVRAVVPATERIDLGKVRALLGSGDVHLATEQALAGAYPEFELGAVPPVGGPSDCVLVDRRLGDAPSVVFEAGTHEQSIRIKMADLVTVANAQIADICAD